MKKKAKIIISVIILIIILTIFDIISIYKLNRPIFIIKKAYNKYYGLFYDTYYCPEFTLPQIKIKGTKYSCSTQTNYLGTVKEIKDTTKNIKDFVCAEALESFYEDENYVYYNNCIKSKYIIVKYESGFEETVTNALKNGTITISYLDKYNIDYIKYDK